MIRHRGDISQANSLAEWLDAIVVEYNDSILCVDQQVADIWASLRVPHHEIALDMLIAATALSHLLTLVARSS